MGKELKKRTYRNWQEIYDDIARGLRLQGRLGVEGEEYCMGARCAIGMLMYPPEEDPRGIPRFPDICADEDDWLDFHAQCYNSMPKFSSYVIAFDEVPEGSLTFDEEFITEVHDTYADLYPTSTDINDVEVVLSEYRDDWNVIDTQNSVPPKRIN